ncbi:hypothetical protein AMTRI_Chr08g166640 [Amborella trichopoda]
MAAMTKPKLKTKFMRYLCCSSLEKDSTMAPTKPDDLIVQEKMDPNPLHIEKAPNSCFSSGSISNSWRRSYEGEWSWDRNPEFDRIPELEREKQQKGFVDSLEAYSEQESYLTRDRTQNFFC